MRQVIDVAKSVSGVDFSVVQAEAREGDPAVLIADANARDELGWSPQYGALETIIDHAWRFERARYGRP